MKVYSVEGRTLGQAFIEFGSFESREKANAVWDKIFADKEFQDLSRERIESGLLVPGTSESFLLTDY